MAIKKKKKRKSKPAKGLKRKTSPKKKAIARKPAPRKKAAPKRRGSRGKSESIATVSFDRVGLGGDAAGQSGDLQGLSNSARADSESVDELLEEGNAFEAAAIEGVENAPDADQGEVRTREVPDDDVPDEYLEKDT